MFVLKKFILTRLPWLVVRLLFTIDLRPMTNQFKGRTAIKGDKMRTLNQQRKTPCAA